jgi:hypothetical protein
MQVVIDIDEEQWDWLRNGFPDEDDGEYAIKAIVNGVPLPKGHGRLKDVDKIISDGLNKGFCDWYDEMDDADTIILPQIRRMKNDME